MERQGRNQDDDLPPALYALGSDQAERDRLRRQTEELRGHSATLLARVRIRPGSSVIDLGCGPSGILDLLSESVGHRGHVVGVELNPVSVALAIEFAGTHGLANVQVIQHDARRTGLPDASFDLVHTRTLLINVPDPAAVLAEMHRLVRPGGWVAVMEPDSAVSMCHPPLAAWDRLTEVYLAAFRADGADPFIGRRLPELLRQADFTDIGAEAKADLIPAGHSRRAIRADLVRSMRPKIIDRGIADEQELDQLDRAVRQHLADPRTLVMPNLYFLAWGRKSAG